MQESYLQNLKGFIHSFSHTAAAKASHIVLNIDTAVSSNSSANHRVATDSRL